jgi:hypothetical protein
MPAAEQPAATATHVIPMGMDMPVSLPMMPLYAIVMGHSGATGMAPFLSRLPQPAIGNANVFGH